MNYHLSPTPFPLHHLALVILPYQAERGCSEFIHLKSVDARLSWLVYSKHLFIRDTPRKLQHGQKQELLAGRIKMLRILTREGKKKKEVGVQPGVKSNTSNNVSGGAN